MSAEDEIDIQLHFPESGTNIVERPRGCPIIISGSSIVKSYTQVFINRAARKQMVQHALEIGKGTECGGFLLGRRGFDKEGNFLLVDSTLRAQETLESATSLTFTHETWTVLDKELSNIEPKPKIIGWYHTHPGMGVFYSAQDRFIQEHFFAGEEYLGIVLDGGCEKMGIYQWLKGCLVAINWYTLFAESTEINTPNPKIGGHIDCKA